MLILRTVKIRTYEKGLYFRDREFKGILEPGWHWFIDPLFKVRINIVSEREPRLIHKDLDVIAKSDSIKEHAVVLDIKDSERALVWIDGRFDKVLIPGIYIFWKKFCDIKTEIIDTRNARFIHKELDSIIRTNSAALLLDIINIKEGSVGLYFNEGEYVETLQPGRYAFWKNVGDVKVHIIDLRESILDISGQEIMTSDKVTLRLNGVVTYKVVDPLKSISEAESSKQSLYRESQLALRKIIGTRELDVILADKDSVETELKTIIQRKAAEYGLEVTGLGIRDIILPGDMKDLMNKVTEAKKAAEANLIKRREEIAATRSQANTAQVLEKNPTLMRLKELEVLEKIAETSKLSVVLGEKGLAERIVNLI